ncbi:hypothetical protein M0R45_024713 [Rubus argutus]|uniref:Uncharacterized protein n=1 Tax=Rubus argutus TaxID=59490 RepID=A0AAW1WSC5_RUBAR
MSSIFVVLLFLVSCLSMHMYACNASRALGFSTVEESGSRVHHSVNEGVEKILTELSEITSTKSLTRRPSILSAEAETVVIHEKASSGADIISLSTSQIDHEQKSIKMKGLKRQARSLLDLQHKIMI